MRVAAKGLVLALGLAAVPASVMAGMRFSGAHQLFAHQLFVHQLFAHQLLGAPERPMTNMTYHVKDQSRLGADVSNYPSPAGGFAQLDDAPVPPAPDAFGRMPHPLGGIDSMGSPGLAPPPPEPSPRQACEEDIALRAALAGYLGAKMRLQGAQKEAWQNVINAAAPAVEVLYRLCAELPERFTAQPSVPDAMSYAQRRLSAAAEFLAVIREPFRALYETLSADQRAALVPPPAPPM
jgi:hypothetical protein